jgi:hypothetical protein
MSNTIINNVTFAYVKIAAPVNKYQSSDTEFTVDCIVSKADAKAWNKQFPKQKAKEVDNAEFTEKFKMDVPFADQDEQYVIKLKKPDIKNGKQLDPKYRPRVFLAQNGAAPKDITFDVLVANGSKGKASYSVRTNDYGTFAQLDSVLIEDLIEYKSTAVVGAAFGVTANEPAPDIPVVNKQSEAFAKQESPVADNEDNSNDSPF